MNINVAREDYIETVGIPKTRPDYIGQTAIDSKAGQVYVAMSTTGNYTADWKMFTLAPHRLSAHYDVNFNQEDLFSDALIIWNGSEWVTAMTKQRVVNPAINPVLNDRSVPGKKYQLMAASTNGDFVLNTSTATGVNELYTYDDSERIVKLEVKGGAIALTRVEEVPNGVNPVVVLIRTANSTTYSYRVTFSSSLSGMAVKTTLNEVDNIHVTRKSYLNVTGLQVAAFPPGEFFGQLAIKTDTQETYFWGGSTWVLGNGKEVLASDATMATELW